MGAVKGEEGKITSVIVGPNEEDDEEASVVIAEKLRK